MSKKSHSSDAQRTAIMRDLLRRKYREYQTRMPPKCVVLEEVAPSTGFGAGWADALVLGTWPSKGFLLHGYEIKASRSDLKRELGDLRKHQALARYCDTWTLLAWDDKVLDVPGIPEVWGIMRVEEEAEHGHRLVTSRQPKRLQPEPWPRAFVASLVRNAHEQGEAAEHLARALRVHGRMIKYDADQNARTILTRAVEPLLHALYSDQERWRLTQKQRDPEAVVRVAVERLVAASTRTAQGAA